jgi:hypothetical protein
MTQAPYSNQVGRVITERESPAVLRVPRPIDVFQCQTTAGTVFTARDDADFQIQILAASNVSGSNDTVTVYLVPDGGSPGADNTAFFQRQIPAGGTSWLFSHEYTGFLQPGMTLQALCGTNNAINLFGWGYDYQGAYG